MQFDDLLSSEVLTERFNSKIALGYAVGTDGVTVQHFKNQLPSEVATIQRKVHNFSYKFSPFKEKLVIKNKDSKPRVILIPTVRDRLTLDALRTFVLDAFNEDLKLNIHSVDTHIRQIQAVLGSQTFDGFLKLDVKNFFPSLDHDILMAKLQTKIQDKQVLSLCRKVLNRSENGIAQGLSIASLFSEIYLNEFDKAMKHRKDFRYFRFVDDILILCNQNQAKAIEDQIQQSMLDLKLELHIVNVGSKSEAGQIGVDDLSYLGYVFKPDCITVRDSSVERLRQRIQQVFKTELAETPKNEWTHAARLRLYRRLNLKITGCYYDDKAFGWLFFFKRMNDLTLLYHLDWFVKKSFERFGLEYSPTKVKSFVKTYFLMKSLKLSQLDSKSYIPSFVSSPLSQVTIESNVEDDLLDELMLDDELDIDEIIGDDATIDENDSQTFYVEPIDEEDLMSIILELENDVQFYLT